MCVLHSERGRVEVFCRQEMFLCLDPTSVCLQDSGQRKPGTYFLFDFERTGESYQLLGFEDVWVP